jgi:hypothetical protein
MAWNFYYYRRALRDDMNLNLGGSSLSFNAFDI